MGRGPAPLGIPWREGVRRRAPARGQLCKEKQQNQGPVILFVSLGESGGICVKMGVKPQGDLRERATTEGGVVIVLLNYRGGDCLCL